MPKDSLASLLLPPSGACVTPDPGAGTLSEPEVNSLDSAEMQVGLAFQEKH